MADVPNRERSRVQQFVAALLAFLVVLFLVAFFAVWFDTWNGVPDEVAGARDWWSDFVLRRVAWSLLLGVPAGALAAVVTWRLVSTRS